MCFLAKYRFASENQRYSSTTEAPKRNRVQAVFYVYWGSPPSAPKEPIIRERATISLHTPTVHRVVIMRVNSQSAYSSIPSSLSLSLFPSGYRSLLFPPRPVSRFFRSLLLRLGTNRPRRPRMSSARSISVYPITYTCTNDIRKGVGMLRLTPTQKKNN